MEILVKSLLRTSCSFVLWQYRKNFLCCVVNYWFRWDWTTSSWRQSQLWRLFAYEISQATALFYGVMPSHWQGVINSNLTAVATIERKCNFSASGITWNFITVLSHLSFIAGWCTFSYNLCLDWEWFLTHLYCFWHDWIPWVTCMFLLRIALIVSGMYLWCFALNQYRLSCGIRLGKLPVSFLWDIKWRAFVFSSLPAANVWLMLLILWLMIDQGLRAATCRKSKLRQRRFHFYRLVP